VSETTPEPSSLLERLDLDPETRCAIVHCDDIGMCHASNVGAFEALKHGPATCGSIMVPCAWFEEAVSIARSNPELDLGVHLTLTSEWEHYCWGPVAGANAVPSLVDERGAFPRTVAELLEQADPDEVETELRSQIERALNAGIDVTHLDAHMGAAFFPPLSHIYVELGLEYRLPILTVPPDAKALQAPGMEAIRRSAESSYSTLKEARYPIIDQIDANSLGFAEGAGAEHNAARLEGIERGVTYLICHPAKTGDELEAMTNDAHCRDFERTFYGGETGRRALEAEGIITTGMRALRDLIRAEKEG